MLEEQKFEVVCFTGHRPDKLGGYDERNPVAEFVKAELRDVIEKLIERGARKFVCGGALGVDTWAAEIVLELKAEHPDLYLLIVKPFAGQHIRWKPSDIARYEFICAHANEVQVACPGEYAAWKMQRRNEVMVDMSDVVVAVWDGSKGGTANCRNYALGKKYLYVINPKDYSVGQN